MPPDLGMSGITNSLTCYGHTEMCPMTVLEKSSHSFFMGRTYKFLSMQHLWDPLNQGRGLLKEVILALTSACNLAAKSLKVAQKYYKDYYDRGTKQVDYYLGGWVFNRFPVAAWTISHCG